MEVAIPPLRLPNRDTGGVTLMEPSFAPGPALETRGRAELGALNDRINDGEGPDNGCAAVALLELTTGGETPW